MVASGYFLIENVGFYLFVVAVLACLAIYTWQFRQIPGAMMAVLSQVCKAAWLLFLVLAGTSAELPDKIFWIGLQKMAAVLMPYLWLVFTLKISRQEALIPAAVKYGIAGCVGALWLVLLTNWHGLFWRDAWLDGQTVWFNYGPGPWVALVFGYLLSIFNTVLSLRWIHNAVGLRRRQALWYFTAVMISWAFHALWFVSVLRAFAIPLGFLLSGMVVAWIYYRWQLYSIWPLAQTTVIRDMIDGLVVVDEQGYVTNINAAAKAIFGELPVAVGSKFSDLADAWPALAETGGICGFQTLEAFRKTGYEERYYQINVTSLKAPGGHLLGKVIMLKDISLQKKAQLQTVEQQKALSVLAERERLGRELHDGQGQIWNYLNLELQTVRSLLIGGQIQAVHKQIDRLIGVVKELNDDARESIVGLKKPASASDGFVANLQSYLAWYEKNNHIATRLILPPEPVTSLFNYASEVQLLRIIQEALTNVRKHAQAQAVEVTIQKLGSQVTVLVEDDGRGFDPATAPGEKKSFGLQIMAERAAEAGGRLTIQAEPGKGTKVMVLFDRDKRESAGDCQ